MLWHNVYLAQIETNEVITAWSAVLNYEERLRKPGTPVRLFCNAGMLRIPEFNGTEHNRIEKFIRRMEGILEQTDTKNFHSFQMVIVPILYNKHYILLFFNLAQIQILVIDNIEGDVKIGIRYSGYVEKTGSLKVPWQTIYNRVDCGIFVMRHMETFNGTTVREWDYGLSPKRDINGVQIDKRSKELADLWTKYISKILLGDVNTVWSMVKLEVQEYAMLTNEDRIMNAENAMERILYRLDVE